MSALNRLALASRSCKLDNRLASRWRGLLEGIGSDSFCSEVVVGLDKTCVDVGVVVVVAFEKIGMMLDRAMRLPRWRSRMAAWNQADLSRVLCRQLGLVGSL